MIGKCNNNILGYNPSKSAYQVSNYTCKHKLYCSNKIKFKAKALSEMASRTPRMTAQQVLEMLSDSEEVDDMDVGSEWDGASDGELDELDDPDEPLMEGSDDEFSDLGEVEDNDESTVSIQAIVKCNSLPHKAYLYF